MQAGAEVVVVSPEVLPELAGMDVDQHRPYEYGDLEGANLAFTATDSREVNAAVVREAEERGSLSTSPTVLLKGISLYRRRAEGWSTGRLDQRGVATLARRIRGELEEAFGPEWAGVVEEFDTARRSGSAGPGRRR